MSTFRPGPEEQEFTAGERSFGRSAATDEASDCLIAIVVEGGKE